jgi:hypothetical protein
MKYLDRILAVAAFAMGVVSIVWLRDADKSPIYFLVGYVLWRIR